MPMSLTDFSAIACSEPIPAHTHGSEVEKGVWILVVQMNINRMHGGLKTLKRASPVTLETQKLWSSSSWLEQNYIVSGGQPRLTNPPRAQHQF